MYPVHETNVSLTCGRHMLVIFFIAKYRSLERGLVI